MLRAARSLLEMLTCRFRRKSGVVTLLAFLSACGGGSGEDPPSNGPPSIVQFSADRTAYFIGERAHLTARFANGTARIQPGDIAVQDGLAVMSLPLKYGPNEFELTVSGGATTATRRITLNAAYRNGMRTVDAPFARAEHVAIRLPDGRVLIAGGDDGSNTLPTALWAFDPATEQFSDFGASLSTGRFGFTAVTLSNGNILIAGGERGLIAAPSAEVIRPADRTVLPTAMPVQRPRTFAAATLLMDGRVFISGGVLPAASNTVEVYDPTSGEFTLLEGRLSVGRYAHTSVQIDARRILIYGGFTLTGQLAPPEIYDPIDAVSNQLQPGETNVRGNHVAHTMQDGGVLIIGGEEQGSIPLTSVLRFDPANGVIAPFANLATPRTLFALGRLADERVLIVGGIRGQADNDVGNTTETLAMDGVRRDGPVMSRARWHHTVTALVDGRLLIVGGLGPDSVPLRAAEIYE